MINLQAISISSMSRDSLFFKEQELYALQRRLTLELQQRQYDEAAERQKHELVQQRIQARVQLEHDETLKVVFYTLLTLALTLLCRQSKVPNRRLGRWPRTRAVRSTPCRHLSSRERHQLYLPTYKLLVIPYLPYLPAASCTRQMYKQNPSWVQLSEDYSRQVLHTLDSQTPELGSS